MTIEQLQAYGQKLQTIYGANQHCNDDRNHFKQTCIYPTCEDVGHINYYDKFNKIAPECNRILIMINDKIRKLQGQQRPLVTKTQWPLPAVSRGQPVAARTKKIKTKIEDEDFDQIIAHQQQLNVLKQEKINLEKSKIVQQIIAIFDQTIGPDYSKLTYDMNPILYPDLWYSMILTFDITKTIDTTEVDKLTKYEAVNDNDIINILTKEFDLSTLTLILTWLQTNKFHIIKISTASFDDIGEPEILAKIMLADKSTDNSDYKVKLVNDIINLCKNKYFTNLLRLLSVYRRLFNLIDDGLNLLARPLTKMLSINITTKDYDKIFYTSLSNFLLSYLNIPELEFIFSNL